MPVDRGLERVLDDPTTDVLAFVGRLLAIEPIAMLASVRDGAADPFADADLPAVRVGPLGDAPARALLLASSPGLPRARQDRLLKVAQGNPLALIELPKAADGTVPPLTPTTRHVPVTAVLECAFTHRVAALPGRPGRRCSRGHPMTPARRRRSSRWPAPSSTPTFPWH